MSSELDAPSFAPDEDINRVACPAARRLSQENQLKEPDLKSILSSVRKEIRLDSTENFLSLKVVPRTYQVTLLSDKEDKTTKVWSLGIGKNPAPGEMNLGRIRSQVTLNQLEE